jgi:hypothetical protein
MVRRDAQRDLLAGAADPEGQPRLDGLGVAARGLEAEELTLEVGRLLREQQPDALDRLVDLAQPDPGRRERDAVRNS